MVMGNSLNYCAGQVVMGEKAARVCWWCLVVMGASTNLLSGVNHVTWRRLNCGELMEGDRRHRETTMVPGRRKVMSSWWWRAIEEMLVVDIGRGWRGSTTTPTWLIGVTIVGPEGHVLLARLLHLRIGLLLRRRDLGYPMVRRGSTRKHGTHRCLMVTHAHREWHGNLKRI